MKMDKTGSTDFIHFPAEETRSVIEVMEKAEREADLRALQCAARRLVWLYGVFCDDPCHSDMPFENSSKIKSVKAFNAAWKTCTA